MMVNIRVIHHEELLFSRKRGTLIQIWYSLDTTVSSPPTECKATIGNTRLTFVTVQPLQSDFSHDTWDKPSSVKKSALVDPLPQSTKVTGSSIGCTRTVGSTGCGSCSSGSCFNNFHPLLGRVGRVRSGRARRGTCRAAAAPADSTPKQRWWQNTLRIQRNGVMSDLSFMYTSGSPSGNSWQQAWRISSFLSVSTGFAASPAATAHAAASIMPDRAVTTCSFQAMHNL